MPPYSLSDPAVSTFILMPIALVAGLAWGVARTGAGSGVRAAAGGAAWMAATGLVAATGVLREWDAFPPPFALLVLSIVGVSSWLAFGPWGRGLAARAPLWTLVGVQGFRLPLELAMHGMVGRGIMPEQMSYTGFNFDIVTGASALLVAGLVRHGYGSVGLVKVWNVMGLALLANVVTIAIASTPAFRAFGDDRLNVWVTYPPFVWLPSVMVVAALAGHLIIWRALRQTTPHP